MDKTPKNDTTSFISKLIIPVIVIILISICCYELISKWNKSKYTHVETIYKNFYKRAGFRKRVGEYPNPIKYANKKVIKKIIKEKIIVEIMHSYIYNDNEIAITMADISIPKGNLFYRKYYSLILLSLKRDVDEDDWLKKLLHFGHGGGVQREEWQNILLFNLCITNLTNSPTGKNDIVEQHSICYMNEIKRKFRNRVIQVTFDTFDPFSKKVVKDVQAFFYDDVAASLQSIMELYSGKWGGCFYTNVGKVGKRKLI